MNAGLEIRRMGSLVDERLDDLLGRTVEVLGHHDHLVMRCRCSPLTTPAAGREVAEDVEMAPPGRSWQEHDARNAGVVRTNA